jgi:L-aminopeptidase/D-esterase-like protein
MAAVNAFGDIVEPRAGHLVAGLRLPEGGFGETSLLIEELAARRQAPSQHTTLAVVGTDASLDRAELLKVAQIAQTRLARAIRPVHTGLDGDVVFALSTCHAPRFDPTIVGVLAAEALAEAVVRAVTAATSLAGRPAVRELV